MNTKYIEWLERKIDQCLEDKDLKREHWAFCQALKKYREFCNEENPAPGGGDEEPLTMFSKDSKKNRVSFEIVDVEKFVRVDDVITEGLKGSEGKYFGTLIINLWHEEKAISMPVDGWFDQDDYIEEYGFRLIDIRN